MRGSDWSVIYTVIIEDGRRLYMDRTFQFFLESGSITTLSLQKNGRIEVEAKLQNSWNRAEVENPTICFFTEKVIDLGCGFSEEDILKEDMKNFLVNQGPTSRIDPSIMERADRFDHFLG